MDQKTSYDSMQLTSAAFKNNEPIPVQYTCKGQDISPPLNFINVPIEAKSLALIMHDPDAPVGDFVHWLMWDMQSSTQSIGASKVPVGAMQGKTDFGKNQYGGPCPPTSTGTHRYIFELYALDSSLNLKSDTTREKLEDAMNGHVLVKCLLTGKVSADDN
jgi:Raf kinase inhibitor-like YbhB/YbcL family protein